MSISEPFIRRPVATFLLAFALMIAGSAAFTQLPVAPLPRVDFPTINISASLPGAAPQTMASSVATPLERRFGRIAGLNEMTSASTLGTTSITLQFDLDRDVDSAARDVQAAINAAGGDLPPNLPTRPNYRKVNPADSPILIYAIKSKTVPLSTIYDIGNTIFAQKISQVTGVGQVFVGGGQQPAVRVQADPAALAGANLSLEDVRSALGTQTSNSPKGGFGGSDKAQPIVANDQLLDAAAWKDVVISYHNGAPVKLSDVSKVIDSVENERVAGWENGERTVMLIIRRQPGANIIDVIERVKKIVPELARSISPAIDVSVALVVMVVFLFLRSVWATIIPSVAVPLSLVATFAIMYLLGYSLDNLSLMALTISTGFVVDDAIVVTENVARFIEEGKKPLEAAILGAKQIGFTIVSITISLLAVFIPILLMGGIIGRLFREFAITLSIAIFVSAIVSLTLTPTMCARMLAHAQHERRGRFDRILERGFQALQDGYAKALRFVLRHRVLVGIITIATVTLVVVLLKFFMHFGLFPQQDTGMLAGSTDAPQDISFPAMKERQQALEHVVEADPDVLNAVSFIGGGGGSTGNTGSMFIELKPKPERKTSADDIINRLRPKLAKVQGIQLFLQSVQDVRMGGRSTRSQYQYTLQSADLDQLLKWAPKMLVALRKIKILQDVNTDQQTAGLELDINVDRDTAARMGISMRDVDNTIYDAFGQRQVATTFTSVNQYRVVLEIKPALARGPESLAQLYVRSSTGNQVPLSAIASFTPAVTLSFNLSPGVALGEAVESIQQLQAELKTPITLDGAFQGTAQVFQSSLSSTPLLVAAAILAVYIVLGMLYES
ncbi:MAG TPA: efflux RND transporter permease subunit, partial [Polyangia bacterium]|nr:efflux RND transporter permease subunit [Polyangia bacterium]